MDSRSVSKWSAAVGLIAAPILYAAAFAVQPAWADDGAAYLAEVAAAQTRHALWPVLFALGSVALLAGMLGVARLSRGPRGWLAQAGSLVVGVASAVIGGVVVAISAAELAMVAGGDRAQMVALYDRTDEVGLAMAVFGVLWGGGFLLGTVVLAAGLLLRRVVPLWSPLLLVAWLVALSVFQSPLGSVLSCLVLLAALLPLAYRVATLSDEQWARWQPLPGPVRAEASPAGEIRTDPV